jgi:serine/threonine-protein kinase
MTADMGQPGQIIDGKYRIVRLLGTGGMGAVFEGENLRIRRKVAIKMLHGSVSTQAEVITRFEREAQAAALVGSDHICEVLDLGELPDHTRYMVMEYLEGDTLSGLIKKSGRLTPPQSVPILLQVLEALGAAHQAGIIHRDLKPDNIFILPLKNGVKNFVKILDFGVSKFSQMGGEAMNVTRAGAVVGTPYYMSPEQARGTSAVDQRTDIYAIGVLLFQATTGQVPYQAETFNELLFKIVLEVPPPPQTYVPDLDPEFAGIIQRAMAREPEQRYQSCAQFRDAVLAYQTSRANPQLPAYNLPQFYSNDPIPAATQVLDLSAMPQSPSYPGMPPSDGTQPMQPGLNASGHQMSTPGMMPPAGLGSGANWQAPNPAAMQSAPNWGAPNPGAMPLQQTSTSASWGNASSPANNVGKPSSGSGMVVGVIVGAVVLGVAASVAAFVFMGKQGGGPAQANTGKAVASATPAPPPPTTTTTAATPAPTASASASATASAAPADTAAKPAPSGKPSVPVAPPPGTQAAKPPPGLGTAKPGTVAKPPGKGKGGGNDLGY